MIETAPSQTIGYMPDDRPPAGAMLSLGVQQVLTMFPATVLVAVLTKFDVGALGGCAGTNYGENNSLMAITRNLAWGEALPA